MTHRRRCRRAYWQLWEWHRAAAAVFAGVLLTNASIAAIAGTIDDCNQDNSAPLVVQACSALIADAKTDPSERGRIYMLRGVAWMKEEEPAAAVSDFTRAINVDASNAGAIRGRAQAYAMLGKHELAVADWSRLVDIAPNQEEYYRNRGAANLAAGKSEAAMADYTRALEIDPKSLEAYIGRASVYERLENRKQVLSEFATALAINPGYIPAYWAKAQMAERWGDSKLAIESYTTLLNYNGVYWHARKALQRLGINHQP